MMYLQNLLCLHYSLTCLLTFSAIVSHEAAMRTLSYVRSQLWVRNVKRYHIQYDSSSISGPTVMSTRIQDTFILESSLSYFSMLFFA